jgi:hypothetical protein
MAPTKRYKCIIQAMGIKFLRSTELKQEQTEFKTIFFEKVEFRI